MDGEGGVPNKNKEVGKFFEKISGGTLISDPRVHGL